MLPRSVERVPMHTAEEVNERIRRQTQRNIAHFAKAGSLSITRRLNELDAEWDTERTLEANASSLALIGVGLGALFNRKWLILPAVVTGFLLQHALQGWCPPLPVLRRMGVRTRSEIDRERYALKALRGDFKDAPNAEVETEEDAENLLRMTER